MPAKNESSNNLAVPDAQLSVSVIPTALKAPKPEPESAQPQDLNLLTATVHYFPLGDAYKCWACENPNAKVHTIRITRTMAGGTLVTPMCENCAGEEVDGVLERGDLIPSDDGSCLISPMAKELEERLAGHRGTPPEERAPPEEGAAVEEPAAEEPAAEESAEAPAPATSPITRSTLRR